MSREEMQEKVNKTLKVVLDKMINNPDGFIDNYKLQEKYNNALKDNMKLKKRKKKLEDGFGALVDELCEYAKENEVLKYQLELSKQKRLKAIELLKQHQRKDEFINLNEYNARELFEILGEKHE